MTVKLGLVQPNYQVGPASLNAYYLPYSVGVLWAYAKNTITIDCEVVDWVFKRDPLDEVVERLKNCDVVAMSCYVWNRNYCFTLSRRLKDANPDVLIVMGGPEPPITSKQLFTEFLPAVDIVVRQEGELAFAQILDNYNDIEKIKQYPGLLINVNGNIIDTGEAIRVEESQLQYSPYLEGVFDKLVSDNPSVEWNCTLETNRGCPYQCTFCDWGGLTYSKVKKLGLERVFGELEWMGKNKIGAMHIADANFGIFVERDNLIVDKILEVQAKYGHPYRTGTSWAKNQKSEVIAIAKKLMGTVFNNGLTISVQSMDEHTLDVIKRSNLAINKIGEIYEEANKNNLPVSTELIMPLPGETYDSWKKGIMNLVELGQHNGVEMYQTQLLENTEMNLLQKKLHKIKSVKAYGYMNNSTPDKYDECPETIDVVTETRSMPREDVVKSFLYFWFINTMHVGGFSQLYSRFARKYHNTPYIEFYDKLEKFVEHDEFFIEQRRLLTEKYSQWLEDGLPTLMAVGDVRLNVLVMSFYTLMVVHYEHLHQKLHKICFDFMVKEYPETPYSLIQDLKKLSDNYVVEYNNISTYPRTLALSHDMPSYLFDKASVLENYNTEVLVCYDDDESLPLPVFLENMYFARRRAFGKTIFR